MAQAILAAVGLGACLVLIIRLLLPAPQQRRFDAAARSAWHRMHSTATGLRHWRRNRSEAERVARNAIDRASGRPGRSKQDGVWKGNVYESKSFRRPRKPH